MLTNPIGLIITAISLLIGIGYLLYRNWDKIAKALASAWNWLKNNWQKLLQAFLWTNPILAPIMALNKLVQYVFGIDLFSAGKKIIESLWKGILSVADKPHQRSQTNPSKAPKHAPFQPCKGRTLKRHPQNQTDRNNSPKHNPSPLGQGNADSPYSNKTNNPTLLHNRKPRCEHSRQPWRNYHLWKNDAGKR